MAEKLLKQIIKETINNVLNEELNLNTTFWNIPYGNHLNLLTRLRKG